MILSASLVRMTKGAAASIILLMLADPAGGNQEWIERYTGYTDKPVSQALGFLMEIGIIGRAGERGEFRYFLANQEKQLPLPMDQIEPASDRKNFFAPEEPSSGHALRRIEGCRSGESESFRLDPLEESGSSRSLDSSSSQNLPLPDSSASESEKFRLEALLDRHGVRNPARRRLLSGSFDHDTLQAHLVLAENPGQAIYRIEHNWPVDLSRWRDWLSLHCQECERYLAECDCEFDEDFENEER